MKCYFHNEVESQITCQGCNKPLCSECYDLEAKDFCYNCALNYKNKQHSIKLLQGQKSERILNHNPGINKFISWYQIIGGSIGVLAPSWLLLFFVLSGFQSLNLIEILAILVFLGLYLISIIAGILLLKRHPLGSKLSIGIQIIQIPQLALGGIQYIFVSGASLAFAIHASNNGTSIGFSAWILSKFNFVLSSNAIFLLFGINFIPIVIIYLIKTRVNSKPIEK